jgi:hypothetical protein
MDGFTPVIVIEGFLGLGVVLLLYVMHIREMRKIRAEKVRKAMLEKTGDAVSKETCSAPPGQSTK